MKTNEINEFKYFSNAMKTGDLATYKTRFTPQFFIKMFCIKKDIVIL